MYENAWHLRWHRCTQPRRLLRTSRVASRDMCHAAVACASDCLKIVPELGTFSPLQWLKKVLRCRWSQSQAEWRLVFAQRLVHAEVGLETPPQELDTYARLWRLVPYLDDEAVAQLLGTQP